MLWSLFVAKDKCAGIPQAMSAGRVISPPPPTIESIKPAKRATKKE